MKALFLALDPPSVASTRYRICQYLPFFERSGVRCELRTYADFSRDSPKASLDFLNKAAHFARAFSTLSELLRGDHDVVFISRLLLPFTHFPLLTALRRCNTPLVYDLDDAVFTSQPYSVRALMGLSSAVVAGNRYLMGEARRFNPRTLHIPTSVDCSTFRSLEKPRDRRPTIGWLGSPSATPYITSIAPAIKMVVDRYDARVRVMGASAGFGIPGVAVDVEPWSLEREVPFLNSLDIGLYPLAEDRWCLGKCAFKAVQYMATGTPYVASPVGANKEVAGDGVECLFAVGQGDWARQVGRLIESPELRRDLGANGRKTAESQFSVQANLPVYLSLFRTLHEERLARCAG